MTVDQYIQSFPKETIKLLETIRKTIKEVLPNAEERISYQIPAFYLDGKYVIYFAGWKEHVSLYPYTASSEEKLKLGSRYEISGRGTIKFPLNKPLPISIIKKIVKFRYAEVQKLSQKS